jgi:hypothetical protein
VILIVSRLLRTAEDASRMSQHARTVLQLGGRWLPPHCEAASQQLVSRWLVIPHGDRRESAQSSRSIDKHQGVCQAHNKVVRKLVLNYDIRQHTL